MATSRIAHYLKAICRDKIGSFMSRGECEKFLNNWISNYVLDQDDATQEAKAKRPLREARIDVIEDKARPGCYKAVAYLQAALPAGGAGRLAAAGGRSAAGGEVGEQAPTRGRRGRPLGRERRGPWTGGGGCRLRFGRRADTQPGGRMTAQELFQAGRPRRGHRGADSRGQVPSHGRGPALPAVRAAVLRGRARARRGPARGGEPRPTGPQGRIGCLSQPARGRVRAPEGVPRGLAPLLPPDPRARRSCVSRPSPPSGPASRGGRGRARTRPPRKALPCAGSSTARPSTACATTTTSWARCSRSTPGAATSGCRWSRSASSRSQSPRNSLDLLWARPS